MAQLKTSEKALLPQDSWFGGSGTLLEAIVYSSQDAIITKDLNGVITSWNPAACRIFGYSPEEVVGRSVLLLIPTYLHHEEVEILAKLRAGQQIEHFETVRVRKDGREIIVSLTISPVWNKEGTVGGVSKIVRDITEQKQLDLARFRLAAIVDSADDAIISKDLNGIVKTWNGAAERIFGYTEAEMVGESIRRLIPPELCEEEDRILERIRRGVRVEHFESVRMCKSGRRIEVSLAVSPLRDASGRVVGASKIARDISERKAMEDKVAQVEKLAASGKMAATIAHEINNPLEAVLNLIYLAKVSTTEPIALEFLTSAEGEMERLAHIAKQSLGFYREQNAAKPVVVPELVKDTLRIYDSRLRSQEIAISTVFATERSIVLRRGELSQVISNLITNAAQAMTSGGTLTITVEDCVRNADGVLLTVADTGVGISPGNLKRVFEPFFTTRASVGTGIGLWIARQFVEGHGGTIEVESSTGAETHGSTFTLWLPLESPYASPSPRAGQEIGSASGR